MALKKQSWAKSYIISISERVSENDPSLGRKFYDAFPKSRLTLSDKDCINLFQQYEIAPDEPTTHCMLSRIEQALCNKAYNENRDLCDKPALPQAKEAFVKKNPASIIEPKIQDILSAAQVIQSTVHRLLGFLAEVLAGDGQMQREHRWDDLTVQPTV